MSIKKLRYSEFKGDSREWSIDSIDFNHINLLVGKNSTGKSRVLNCINSLCKIISGNQAQAFDDGQFLAEFVVNNHEYTYEIAFKDRKVLYENLLEDGINRLSRADDGRGEVYYSSEGKKIAFQISQEAIAIQSKNDSLQHPFIHELSQWASGAALYNFGSDFGKTQLVQYLGDDHAGASNIVIPQEKDNLINVYINAFKRYGEQLDALIIKNMHEIGYNLTDVGVESVSVKSPVPLLGLFTSERELGELHNPQFNMSQGMFRSLAIIINLNVAILAHDKNLVLIDDIGEGLDYERSTKLIEVITSSVANQNIQVIMTSNDRFVMNQVPLEYWAVLERRGRCVKAFTQRNSPEIFENFKFIGLSNFDFFRDTRFH